MSSLAELFGKQDDVCVVNGSSESESILVSLARKVIAMRERQEAARAELGEAIRVLENMEIAMLEEMDRQSIKSLRVKSGQLLTSVVKNKYSLPPKHTPEERKKALKWLSRVGGKDLIEADIHWQRLNSFLKERKENNKDISPLIQVFEQKSLSIKNS
jgi:hypothetical protein